MKPTAGGVSVIVEVRWASETGAHSMPHPDELRYLGYQPLTDPRYPGSLLMRRDG